MEFREYSYSGNVNHFNRGNNTRMPCKKKLGQGGWIREDFRLDYRRRVLPSMIQQG